MLLAETLDLDRLLHGCAAFTVFDSEDEFLIMRHDPAPILTKLDIN